MKLTEILSGKSSTDYEQVPLNEISINGNNYRTDIIFTLTTPTIITGLDFGIGLEYNEIIANSIIDAKEYWKMQSKRDIPIYVQTQVGKCLEKRGFDEFGSFGEMEEESASNIFSRVTTKEILEKIKKSLEPDSINKNDLAYFAHPGHVYRVMEIGKRLGFSGGVFLPKEVVWPENDTQPWVRNPKDWKKREFKARMHHWIFGWVPREL